MELPFDRKRLGDRNVEDDVEAIEHAAAVAPADRLRASIELSTLVGELRHATGSDSSDPGDLDEKARLYAAPLRVLATQPRRP